MHRHIITLDNGNVLVVTFDSEGQPTSREYTRRGPCVYVVQDHGPRLPACLELRPQGEQLLIRRGESLEQTIRRTLADAEQKNSRALTLWDVAFAFGVFGTCVAVLTALAAIGGAALVASALSMSAMTGFAAAMMLAIAAAGLVRLWREFPHWHWLLSGVAALTVLGCIAYAVWLGQQPLNFIR